MNTMGIQSVTFLISIKDRRFDSLPVQIIFKFAQYAHIHSNIRKRFVVLELPVDVKPVDVRILNF